MEELLKIIQQDPELWELVEQLKHQDQEPMEFFENVANMFAVEFEELHRTDLKDKTFCTVRRTSKEVIYYGSLHSSYCT